MTALEATRELVVLGDQVGGAVEVVEVDIADGLVCCLGLDVRGARAVGVVLLHCGDEVLGGVCLDVLIGVRSGLEEEPGEREGRGRSSHEEGGGLRVRGALISVLTGGCNGGMYFDYLPSPSTKDPDRLLLMPDTT